jgi:hypothetical protein
MPDLVETPWHPIGVRAVWQVHIPSRGRYIAACGGCCGAVTLPPRAKLGWPWCDASNAACCSAQASSSDHGVQAPRSCSKHCQLRRMLHLCVLYDELCTVARLADSARRLGSPVRLL